MLALLLCLACCLAALLLCLACCLAALLGLLSCLPCCLAVFLACRLAGCALFDLVAFAFRGGLVGAI
ncbi:MAG: hypothetical protein E2602_08020 [Achromobacter sp.]|nr:hypothetical protein [Achromobacter sp.]